MQTKTIASAILCCTAALLAGAALYLAGGSGQGSAGIRMRTVATETIGDDEVLRLRGEIWRVQFLCNEMSFDDRRLLLAQIEELFGDLDYVVSESPAGRYLNYSKDPDYWRPMNRQLSFASIAGGAARRLIVPEQTCAEFQDVKRVMSRRQEAWGQLIAFVDDLRAVQSGAKQSSEALFFFDPNARYPVGQYKQMAMENTVKHLVLGRIGPVSMLQIDALGDLLAYNLVLLPSEESSFRTPLVIGLVYEQDAWKILITN